MVRPAEYIVLLDFDTAAQQLVTAESCEHAHINSLALFDCINDIPRRLVLWLVADLHSVKDTEPHQA